MKSLTAIRRFFCVIALLAALPGRGHAQATPDFKVYVALPDLNSVAVIDGLTNTVLNTISVANAAGTRPFSLAITPDGKFAYVVNESCGLATPPTPTVTTFGGSVSVIDTVSGTVVASIPVGLCPAGIAITPDGTRAYVSNVSSGTVSVIDTSAQAVLANITLVPIPFSTSAGGLAINPDGGHVYVTAGELEVISTATNSVVSSVPLTFGFITDCTPDKVGVTPDGRQIYVTSGSTGTICGTFFVVDSSLALSSPNSSEVFSPSLTFTCGQGGFAIAPNGQHAYLADSECDVLYVIDTVTATHPHTSSSAGIFNPYFVALKSDGTLAFLSGVLGGQMIIPAGTPGLMVIDTATNSVPAALSIPLSGVPAGLAIAPTDNTPVGTSVTVQPLDKLTNTSPVTLTFSSVSQAGFTSLFINSAGPPAPTGFQLGSPSVYYDLATTAQYTGLITVCINYTGISFAGGTPALLHYQNGAWVNTTTTVNTTTNIVCGTVSSLSPFGLFAQAPNLTVSAATLSMAYGGAVPTITAAYAGFVNGDTAASLTTQPTCTTTATSSSPIGTYPTTCSGAVDPNYTISYAAGTLTITAAPLTITASSGAMVYGGPIPAITASFSGFVNGQNSTVLTAQPICSTTATSTSPAGASFPSACAGAAAANYMIAYVPGTVTVGKATSTTTITSQLPNPSVAQQAVAVAFAVAPQFTGPPTGNVLVTASSGQSCSAALAAGAGGCQLTFTAAGTPTLTAVYSGDGNFLASTSPGVSQTVTSGAITPTSTKLATSRVLVFVGQAVAFTAKVSSRAGAPPNGELVTFSDAGNPIGTGTTSSGAATFTTSSLKAGEHKITATYGGDATLAGSVSPAILEVVVPDPTKTVLTSGLNPALSGQAVMFTATVTTTGHFAPTGTITFRSLLTTLATVPINNGAASYTTAALPTGSTFITATYNGDSNNLPSLSQVLTEMVKK